ncbi:MAG TPA: sensor domain-containing diguanylate cyclase, partial [Pseudoduganella sp.]
MSTFLSHARRVSRKLYRMILLPSFTLALLAAMWSAVIWQVRQEEASAHHEAVQQSQSLARTLAEHSSYLLRQADHATQLFKLKYEETDGALRLAEFTRRGGLLDSVMPARLELPIALVNANGRLVESRNGYFDVNFANRPFFRTLATSMEDLALVTNPMVDPVTKKWQIQIARRLDDKNGAFGGVVLMMIDPAYFVEDYDRMHIEPQGLVMLVSRDTGLAIGRVDERLFITDTVDFVTQPAADGSADELLMKRPIDSVPRIYSYRDMPRFSLTAVVGNATEFAMAKFERQRRVYFGAAILASLIVLIFAALLTQQSRRLRSSMQAANDAQAKMRAAADASFDALFLLKASRDGARAHDVTDYVLVDVNER